MILLKNFTHNYRRIIQGAIIIFLPYHVMGQSDSFLDESFRKLFKDPPKEYRIVQYGSPSKKKLDTYTEYGIGGFMAFFYNALRDSSHPKYKNSKDIGPMIEAANNEGFQVWLADDYGYPSGMAGGKVVEQNPEYEVRGLVQLKKYGNGTKKIFFQIPNDTERIIAAVLYPLEDGSPVYSEAKVVSVNRIKRIKTTGLSGDWLLSVFAAKIRDEDAQAQQTIEQFGHTGHYPDLMNPEAVRTFINLMHCQISNVVGGDISSKVEGFYTNEPNLMQLHWDWHNPEGPYAYLPWNSLLPEKFKRMHGYELLPWLGAVYDGENRKSRRARMHFYQTVAELLTENYARQIRMWSNNHGVLSSGHFLLNEYLSMHVANYGDLMKFVSEFDVPAVDIGIPDSSDISSFSYQRTKFFSSVAAWKKQDKVICLPDPIIGYGSRMRLSPAIPLVRNSINMAFLHGANQMTSYLPLDRNIGENSKAEGYTPKEYRSLNEYVGRISMLLRGAKRETAVALYYPISMFQAEYKPSRMFWNRVVPKYKERQHDWEQTELSLLNANIDYNIIHPQALEEAKVHNGTMNIGYGTYRYLVMPQVEIISKKGLEKIKKFEDGGGRVIWVEKKPVMGAYAKEDDEVLDITSDVETIQKANIEEQIGHPFNKDFKLKFELEGQPISIARFQKDDQCIYYLVNKGEESIEIKVHGNEPINTKIYDPFTGNVNTVELPSSIKLKGLGSLLMAHSISF